MGQGIPGRWAKRIGLRAQQGTTKQTVRGIILAAGVSSRLRPLTAERPKCLLPLGDRAILDWQLEALESIGVTEIVMVVGYRREMIIHHVSQRFPHMHVQYVFNADYETTNTLFSLRAALAEHEGDFYYLNADVVFDSRLLSRLCSGEDGGYLAIDAKQCREEEVKVMQSGSQILSIGKHLPPEACEGEFVGVAKFAGSFARKFRDQVFASAVPGNEMKFFEHALETMPDKSGLVGVDVTGLPCVEVDFVSDYELAVEQVARQLVPVRPTRVIEQIDACAKRPIDIWTNYLYYPISIRLVYLIRNTRISPNDLTLFSLMICLAGAAFFAVGEMPERVAGLILVQISYVFDCADGQLARFKKQYSALGGWFDQVSDRVKEFIIYFSLAYGYSRYHAADMRVWEWATLALFTLYLLEYFGQIRLNSGVGKSTSPESNPVPDRPASGVSHVEMRFARFQRLRSYVPFRGFIIGEQYFTLLVFLAFGAVLQLFAFVAALGLLMCVYRPAVQLYKWRRGYTG